MIFLRMSHELLKTSYKLIINVLWPSFKCPKKFLRNSYGRLMNFLKTSNELELLKNHLLQTY
jgi:hypothetical protein